MKLDPGFRVGKDMNDNKNIPYCGKMIMAYKVI